MDPYVLIPPLPQQLKAHRPTSKPIRLERLVPYVLIPPLLKRLQPDSAASKPIKPRRQVPYVQVPPTWLRNLLRAGNDMEPEVIATPTWPNLPADD
ncbi:hypothetical protein AAF712_014102 [Marasmius tenuissimus]|uniref:Uncharacterized protein n=1 Tax=Marasmius tenuissimus TaxID=585030 RepID=A0ABR2ZEH5_9AGAR